MGTLAEATAYQVSAASLRGAALDEPAAERLGVERPGALELLWVERVDPRGKRADLGGEGLEELGVGAVERRSELAAPRLGQACRHAEFGREREQGLVRLVGDLAARLEFQPVSDG